MGEVLILHLSHGDENLWDKLVDLLDENGYKINHFERSDKTLTSLKFEDLKIIPEQHQVFVNDKEVILTGKEFPVTLEDSANTVLAILAIMESAKTRMPVEVNYDE